MAPAVPGRAKIPVLFRPEQRHDGPWVIVRPWKPSRAPDLNPTEKVMTKLIALATALILAISTSVSTAQAGNNAVKLGIGIGVGALAIGAIANGAQRSEAREYRERKKVRAARREREEKASTRPSKKSKTETTDVAEKQPVDETINEASSIAASGHETSPQAITGSTELASQPEHSSIALTSAEVPAPAPAKTKTVETASQGQKSLDCKKFFPSAGMTLSVPCE